MIRCLWIPFVWLQFSLFTHWTQIKIQMPSHSQHAESKLLPVKVTLQWFILSPWLVRKGTHEVHLWVCQWEHFQRQLIEEEDLPWWYIAPSHRLKAKTSSLRKERKEEANTDLSTSCSMEIFGNHKTNSNQPNLNFCPFSAMMDCVPLNHEPI